MKRRITVPGQGSVVLHPDLASIRLGVNVVARTAGAARASAAITMDKVLAALDKTGVARRDVRTALVSLSPTLDYSNGNAPRVTGYQLHNSVSVTLRDVAKAGELIDDALGAGASTLDSMDFRVDDPRAALEIARVAAMDDARARATAIARAASAKMGGRPCRFRGRAVHAASALSSCPHGAQGAGCLDAGRGRNPGALGRRDRHI
jgi:uncharacterized protein YggE